MTLKGAAQKETDMSDADMANAVSVQGQEDGGRRSHPSLLSLLPQYFVAFIALLYASGFLVVLAFFDRYGIRESATDFLRARYIHIGILVLAFPAILNATVFALLYVMKHPRSDLDERKMRQRLWPILLLLINLEILCFMLIMLTRGGEPGSPAVGLKPAQWVLGVILIGVPVILLIDRAATAFIINLAKPEKKADALSFAHGITSVLRWLLIPAVGILDIWFIADFAGHLGGISIWLVGLYIAFSALFGIVIRTLILYEHRPTAQGNIAAYRAIGVCLMFPLFYLMILAFAYGVFPYVPAPRGGGDYTSSPKVVIHFSPDAQKGISNAYLDSTITGQTKPLVLLEEASQGLYAADPSDAGGPAEWRTVGGRKPRLLFVSYSSIASMAFESRSEAMQK